MKRKLTLLGIVVLVLITGLALVVAESFPSCIPVGPCTYYVVGGSSWLPGGQPSGTYGGESQGWTNPNPSTINMTGVWIRYFKLNCFHDVKKKKCTPGSPCANQYAHTTLTYADFNLNNTVYHAAKHKASDGTSSDAWFTSPDGQHPITTPPSNNYNAEAYQGFYGGVCPNIIPDDD
jgi:hypothetical protein